MRILLFLVLTALVSVDAFGVPIYWNTWASSSSGSLTAGASTVAVTFSTANGHAEIAGYPSWLPSNTFADGTLVNNGPVAANGIMQLSGGTTALNTLTFSTPIVNPVFSIWSLGSAGAQASFDFIGLTPVFVAGGTNAEYGGSAISVSGNTVYGREGNGTIEFMGTFSSFQWTNPLYEYWYGFNVGVADVGTTTPVPEPGQALLFSLGVGLLIGFRTLARMKPHSVART